jgi:hypothetical protein
VVVVDERRRQPQRDVGAAGLPGQDQRRLAPGRLDERVALDHQGRAGHDGVGRDAGQRQPFERDVGHGRRRAAGAEHAAEDERAPHGGARIEIA